VVRPVTPAPYCANISALVKGLKALLVAAPPEGIDFGRARLRQEKLTCELSVDTSIISEIRKVADAIRTSR
jgi:hypothetical protein